MRYMIGENETGYHDFGLSWFRRIVRSSPPTIPHEWTIRTDHERTTMWAAPIGEAPPHIDPGNETTPTIRDMKEIFG